MAWWGGGGSLVIKWNCDSVLIWFALKLKGTEGRRFRGRCAKKYSPSQCQCNSYSICHISKIVLAVERMARGVSRAVIFFPS